MLDLADDLRTVFYGSDFATDWLRHRVATPTAPVTGILGVADEEALEGRAIATARVLRLPAGSDVRADDELESVAGLPDQGVAAGTRLRVLDHPRRVTDGAELEVLLGSVGS